MPAERPAAARNAAARAGIQLRQERELGELLERRIERGFEGLSEPDEEESALLADGGRERALRLMREASAVGARHLRVGPTAPSHRLIVIALSIIANQRPAILLSRLPDGRAAHRLVDLRLLLVVLIRRAPRSRCRKQLNVFDGCARRLARARRSDGGRDRAH